jgi:hypothetical protein
MTSLSSLPKDTLLADVEALRAALAAAPVTDARQKALYQCERLAAAIQSSHSEAMRFAAFTVNKAVRDHGAEWPPEVTSRMQAIRETLEAAGLDLSK